MPVPMIDVSRRSFLTGLGTALVVAPAVVRSTSLMKIKGVILPQIAPGVDLSAIVVTPEMFGAVGDGVTDDFKAIQSAINYCTSEGGTLLFGEKTYLSTATFIVGPTVYKKQPMSMKGGVLTFREVDTAIEAHTNLTMEDMAIDCPQGTAIVLDRTYQDWRAG